MGASPRVRLRIFTPLSRNADVATTGLLIVFRVAVARKFCKAPGLVTAMAAQADKPLPEGD